MNELIVWKIIFIVIAYMISDMQLSEQSCYSTRTQCSSVFFIALLSILNFYSFVIPTSILLIFVEKVLLLVSLHVLL